VASLSFKFIETIENTNSELRYMRSIHRTFEKWLYCE